MVESGWIPVRVRDCACPNTPHSDGDLVYLLPLLSLEGGAAAEMDRELVMDGFTEATEAEQTRLTLRLLARYTDTYVRYGAVGWNWEREGEDDKGRRKVEPVPFDVDVLLRDYSLSRLVAGQASLLYSEAVLGPLLEAAKAAKPKPNRQQRRSRNGSTASSTSRKRASISRPSKSSLDEPSAGPALRIAQ